MTLIYFPTSLLEFAFYIRLKKKKIETKNKQNKNQLIEAYNRFVVTRQELG